MSSQPFEVEDDVVPGLEGVAAQLDGCGHRFGIVIGPAGGAGGLHEVVAVEQGALVGDDGVTPGWHADVLLQLLLEVADGGGRHIEADEVDLIALYELAHSLLAGGPRLAVGLPQGFGADVDDGPLALLLPVVDPAYDGQHGVHERVVVHAVLTVKVYGLQVGEDVEGVDQLVAVAEESPDVMLLVGVAGMLEVQLGDGPVFLHEWLVDIELLHAVASGGSDTAACR